MVDSLMKFICSIALCCFLCACHHGSAAPPPDNDSYKRGQFAPNFLLLDQHGDAHRLSDFRGKVVLINFWATWCAPCLREINSLKSLKDQLSDSPFEILGISADDSGRELFSYLKRKKVNYPVLLDRSKQVMRRYGVKNIPYSLVVDKRGRIVFIPNPRDGRTAPVLTGAYEWDEAQIVSMLRSLAHGE